MTGRTITRATLLPLIAVSYFCLDKNARSASRQFFERLQGPSVPAWLVLKHFYTFASVSLDRLYLLAGFDQMFEIDMEGAELFDDLPEGAVLVTSHFGSFEIMRVLAHKHRGLLVHILLDKKHNPSAFNIIERLDPKLASYVIDASSPGPALIVKLSNLLERNQLVGIMGDRIEDGQRSTTKFFLGSPAEFPMGPWIIATLLKRPIICCFGSFEGGRKYRIRFEKIDLEGIQGKSQVRSNWALGQYVEHLESYAQQSPLNWFNFYDFWN